MSDFLNLCHISLLNCTIFRDSAFLRSNYISILCFPRDMSYRIAWIIEGLVYWYWYIGNNIFHHKIILHISDTESLDLCGYWHNYGKQYQICRFRGNVNLIKKKLHQKRKEKIKGVQTKLFTESAHWADSV